MYRCILVVKFATAHVRLSLTKHIIPFDAGYVLATFERTLLVRLARLHK